MPATIADATEPRADAIYHLKIVLMDVAPTIWRRFQVPASMTLAKLHHTIQIVMGWENAHLHQFHIGGELYGSWELGGTKSEDVALGDLVPPMHTPRANVVQPVRNVRSVFVYEYDMGDLWQHEIRVEKVTRPTANHRYPRCVAGAWAAPPEDCGGPNAYRRLQRRRKDVFDVDDVNAELRRAFKLDAEPEPPPVATATPRRRAKKTAPPTLAEAPIADATAADAPPESTAAELEKLRLLRTIFDREVSLLQMGLGLTGSVRKQSQLATEIAHGAKLIDLCDAQIAALEEQLQEEP
jgi:hypothetical protein